MIKRTKQFITLILTTTILLTASIYSFAADNDGWTEAIKTSAASNGEWEKWCKEWENIKYNPVQISLTPGKDESELNFAWYSKENDSAPHLRFGKNINLTDSNEINVSHEEAVKGFISNKATVKNLESGTTYYYSYQVDGKWITPIKYQTQDIKDGFSFIFVGDPQIGSSSGNTATGSSEEQGQDKATRNDSFNWNNTIKTALKNSPDASFMLSAGDQIQTRDKKNPSKTYDQNEIEYAGYLSPSLLKSLPVATTIGNHDAPSGNYSFHFNNPNASNLGSTMAGGDYYYSYGDTLFIMLNTNNLNIAEHEQLIKKAVSENQDAKWRIVTLHQDIYGSGEHSNEPEIVNLRYSLIPIFEDNKVDVVLTGHDHTYSRSFILKGGAKEESKLITKDQFDAYIDEETPIDYKYNEYLTSIEDASAVTNKSNNVTNPNGILYMTANSGSGSKYYDLVQKQQSYIAARWQEDVPTYSIVDITDTTFTINTYRTDNGEKIDDTFTITKTK